VIRVILFDVDGVLAIGEPFSKHLAQTYGITSDLTRSFFEGRFLECLVGKADLKEELAGLLPAWGWSGSIEAGLHAEVYSSFSDFEKKMTLYGIGNQGECEGE